jgi:hypothetical protein
MGSLFRAKVVGRRDEGEVVDVVVVVVVDVYVYVRRESWWSFEDFEAERRVARGA